MSILTHSPAIVRDGLVLCLDAGAVRSYPIFRGSNLITNGEFTTNTTGWAGYGGTTISRVTASSDPGVGSGGTDDYCLKVSGTYMAYDSISTTVGKHYFVRLRGYDASGGNSLKISNTSDGPSLTGVSQVDVTGAEWKTYTSSFIAEGTTTYIRVGANSGGGGVSYWDKIEVYEAVWADLTGQSNDGVINGIDDLSAESGAGGTKSFDFDGTSDYISLGASSGVLAPPFNTVSVFAWIKLDNLSGWGGVFGTYDGGTFIHFQMYLGGVNCYLYGPNTSYNAADSESYVSAGEWAHIGFTYGSTVLTVYVNGEAMPTTVTGSTANVTSATEVSIGRVYASSRMFDGKISIVHAYNRGLTAAEVAQNYRTHKGRFGL